MMRHAGAGGRVGDLTGLAFLDLSLNGLTDVSLPSGLTNLTTLEDGSFQFTFTNAPGTMFSVLASTNISTSLNDWTVLGSAAEISSGQFQFTDPQTTNISRRVYRVRSQ